MSNQFSFNPQSPQQEQSGGNGGNRQSNVDFDALFEYQLQKLGGEGKHQYIGVVSRLDELGIQEQDMNTIPYDDKAKVEHAWRFEFNEKGEIKDPTAKVVFTKYSGKEQECLVYSRKPVTQVAVSVDFPEIMMDLGQFYNPEGNSVEKPFREIVGLNGFIPKSKQGKGQVIAKPFNLNHVDVNRQKKDVKAYWALAKNSLIYSMAEWTESLDDNLNFHKWDLGKLIGKPINYEVEVKVEKWTKDGKENKKLVINITPVSKLSPRDRKYFDDELASKVTDDLFGVLLFDGGNTEKALKEVRKATVNTMKLATNWETSKLKLELEQHNPSVVNGYGQNNAPQASQQGLGNNQGVGVDVGDMSRGETPAANKEAIIPQTPAQQQPMQSQPQYNELPMDFDDDNL